MHEHQLTTNFDLHQLEFILIAAAMIYHVIRYRKQMFGFLKNSKSAAWETLEKKP